jgi:CRP/FNR family transcriptional regulator, cyclic AMP receptor protein
MQTTGIGALLDSPQMAGSFETSLHDRLVSFGAQPVGLASDFVDEVGAFMARTPLFAGLSPDQTFRLCEQMFVYEAQPGTTLIAEGETGDFMMLLMSGLIDVLRKNRYNYPSRIAVAQPGHSIGEMSMFDGEPRFASCVVLEQSRFAVLDRAALRRILDTDPVLGNQLLLRLVQLLSERLRQTSARLVAQMETARDG